MNRPLLPSSGARRHAPPAPHESRGPAQGSRQRRRTGCWMARQRDIGDATRLGPARRNLTVLAKTELALKLEPLLAVKAKEQQVSGLKRGKSVPAILPKREPLDTRAEVAKLAGVSPRMVDAGPASAWTGGGGTGGTSGDPGGRLRAA
jgi:hypothetical protein